VKVFAIRRRAFSLTEVVIALGIISFAVVALLSLLTTALRTGRDATDDSLIAAMAKRTMTELEGTPFTDLTEGNDKTYYFDMDGIITSEKAKALYECTVTLSKPPADIEDQVGQNFKLVQLQFASPVGAANPTKRTLNATIANYN